jgi:uncharacterized protein with GYD domain
MTTYIVLFSLTDAGINFDFVAICEASDDAVMARYVLQLGGLGFVRTKTLKAFPETAYREIICSLG